jgi:hypothetical protein
MLDILQNLFVLPLIAACVIVAGIYGYYKMSHQDELYEKRDYVRYFLYSYLLALATYYAYQKFMSNGTDTDVQMGGGDANAGTTNMASVMGDIADSAESLVDTTPNPIYGIATNIMERFNTGRPTF